MKDRKFLDFMNWMVRIGNNQWSQALNDNERFMSLQDRFGRAKKNECILLCTGPVISKLPLHAKIKIRLSDSTYSPVFDLPICQN